MTSHDNIALQQHIHAINDCNQRGGRMLSLVDLLDADTVNLPLAAYLAAAMRSGASLLVGARPGGAGKTAVMCALLNFLPDETTIQPLDGHGAFVAAAKDANHGKTCYLAHEIGSGYYYAYIWGTQVADFLALAAQGHIVASNLHADTLKETQHQLCQQNPGTPTHLHNIHLKLYLRVERGSNWSLQRRVARVYEANGTQDKLIWASDADGAFKRQGPSTLVTPTQEEHYANFLSYLWDYELRTIEEVRRALIKQ